ncbi:MAG: DUF6455 family protein [Methyloligella sp. ZOD6]
MQDAGQWHSFTQARRRHELMDRMMQKLGVDVLAAIGLDNGQAFVRARSECRLCPQANVCRFWLACSTGEAKPPDFCPNARFFHRCGLLGSHGLWRERRPD